MRLWLLPALLTLLLPGCAQRRASPADLEGGEGESQGETENDTDADTEGTGTPPTDPPPPPQLQPNRDVDILFVIDNSGSMGEEQANLAANFGSFISVLEQPGVDANYRIAVTTTDNGNPWCGTTDPEAGSFVYSSCLNRIGDFTSQSGAIDAGDIACQNICSLDNNALGINANSSPWLENIEGTTNLPAGVTTTEAMQCIGPQGINGCGFESQLESMNKAFIRADTQADAAYGFVRDAALLAVIFVTDEADCSYNNEWATIFEVNGNQVFWHPDSGQSPTSAICWNAGTSCTDAGGGSYDCVATDHDVDGNPLPAGDPNTEDLAVLFPLSRYINRLQGIENDKKEIHPDREVIVGIIAGVDSAGNPHYGDSPNADYIRDFGIGPGCSSVVPGTTPCVADADCQGIGTQTCGPSGHCLEEQFAVPPVRLAEFSDHFTESNKFSICDADYSGALEAIAEAISDQLKPACYAGCAADADPTTPYLEPECVVYEYVGTQQTTVAECLRGADGYVLNLDTEDYTMPDDATNVCFAYRVDASGSTSSGLDDMSQECIDDGYNLEFALARRPGFPAAAGTSVQASCNLSDTPASDCPNL